jgi:hypothetical protein
VQLVAAPGNGQPVSGAVSARPLKIIQELMGHATIEMTMRHAHLAPEARESAVQQLDRPVPQLHAAPARDAGGAH